MICHCNSGKNEVLYQKYQIPTSCYFMEETILSICWNAAAQCQKAKWQAWKQETISSHVYYVIKGIPGGKQGHWKRHFCPSGLYFLWKAIRRVRGSGNCTYSHVVWLVSSWVTASSNRESGIGLEEKRHWSVKQVYQQQLPGVVSVIWSCWDSPSCLWSWGSWIAVLMLLAQSRGVGAGSGLPWTAPARQPQPLTGNTLYENRKHCIFSMPNGPSWQKLLPEWHRRE